MYAPKFRHWMSDHDRLIEQRVPEIHTEIAALVAETRAWLDETFPERKPDPYAGFLPMSFGDNDGLMALLRAAPSPQYSHQQMMAYSGQMGLRTTFPL